MRGVIFVVGLVMLLLGFSLVFWGYSIVEDVKIGLLGSMAAVLSLNTRLGRIEARIMLLIGFMIGIAGLLTAIYGAVTRQQKFTHSS